MTSYNPDELLAIVCAKSFKQFVLTFWSTVSNDPFVDGPHVDAICQHLQALAEGKITRLVINVAIRHSKSLLVSVLYPVWLWARTPEIRIISATYNSQLTQRDAKRSRQLVQSPLFQRLYGNLFKLSQDENRQDYYSNDQKGHRLSVSIGSRTAGLDADQLVIDDLHDMATRNSDDIRNGAIDYFEKTLTSRLVYGNDRIVIAGHRVHEDDVYARLIPDEWTWLVLPEEADPDRTNAFPNALGWIDARQEGELLWPQKFTPSVIAKEKIKFRHEYSAVYLQKPTPQEGTLFKAEWFEQRFSEDLDSLTFNGRRIDKADCWRFTTTDLAIGVKTGNDWTVIANWLVHKGTLFLADMTRKRLDGTKLVPTIASAARDFNASFVVVEDVAFQRMVIDQLKQENIAVKRYKPEGDKETRSITAQILAEQGRVALPNKPATTDFINEVLAFPNGKWDDIVDAFSLAAIIVNRYGKPEAEKPALTPEQQEAEAQKKERERIRAMMFADLPF